MHEVGILQSALEVACEQAAARDATRIHRIGMRIGAFSGVVPEALQFAFDVFSQGTLAEGASFQVQIVPARSSCPACGTEFDVTDLATFTCPSCGGAGVGFSGGRQIEVSEIEIS